MVKLKNPAIHGEFILLTAINRRKVGPNPINIRDVIVDFAEMKPRHMPALYVAWKTSLLRKRWR
jgi:hypothetical protein